MSLSGSRIYGLDILRASAILLVLVTHGVYFFTDSWDVFYVTKYFPDGVSVFFVLSGFLIGNILIKTMNKEDLKLPDLKNFWIRRWFRTLPAYYFVLTMLIVSLWQMSGTHLPVREYLKYFLFLQALDNGNCRLYMESWSLCVEEFFYLFVPVFLFLFIKYTGITARRVFVLCILFVIISGTIYTFFKINLHHYQTNDDWDLFVRKSVFTRLNSIMFGFLGAYLMLYHPGLWKRKTFFFIAGLMLFLLLSVRPAFGIGPFFNYEQLSLESLATLLLIPKLSSVTHGNGMLFRALTFISSISYSVYLVNFTPFYLAETKLSEVFNIHAESYSFLRLALYLIWSIGIGYLVYRWVERPMMKKRELFSQKEHQYAL